jgi:hypothetical protein
MCLICLHIQTDQDDPLSPAGEGGGRRRYLGQLTLQRGVKEDRYVGLELFQKHVNCIAGGDRRTPDTVPSEYKELDGSHLRKSEGKKRSYGLRSSAIWPLGPTAGW